MRLSPSPSPQSLVVLFPFFAVCYSSSQGGSTVASPGPVDRPAAFAGPLLASRSVNTQDEYRFKTLAIEGSISAVADGINKRRLVTRYCQDSNQRFRRSFRQLLADI